VALPILCLKVPLMFKNLVLVYFAILLVSCSSSHFVNQQSNNYVTPNYSLYSPLLVNTQLPAPQSIKSIELYRKGNSENPPIIKLGSSERLVLEFDELTSLGGQYSIRFTHHNQDWSPSNIPEIWYLEGINDLVVQNGDANELSKPNYFRYKTEFPNRQLKFLASGNYLLHVYDFSSNVELFSLPFFVSEEVGTITTSTERVYNNSGNHSTIDQLFSMYDYPKEVMFPQFDMSFSYVQNRFWGNAIEPSQKDIATPGKIRFYTSRNNSFSPVFDFIPLDLSDLNIDNRRIIDWQPEFIPPRIILREDVLNFSASPTPQYTSNFGRPSRSSSSRYASVKFSLEPGDVADANTELYVSGDFNQWRIDKQNLLQQNPETGLWETNVLIKQGKYRYKYFLKNDYTEADFIPLNDAITTVAQEYIGFVYYLDPDYNYQRLLITTTFGSGF